MRSLKHLGQATAAIMIAVAVIHLVIGLGGANLLGAGVPPGVLVNPVLDSQDRFYGAMLGGLGIMLLYGLRDPARYRGVIAIVAWTVIVGGFGRIVSIFATGWPSPLIVLFIAFELIVPSIVLMLLKKVSES